MITSSQLKAGQHVKRVGFNQIIFIEAIRKDYSVILNYSKYDVAGRLPDGKPYNFTLPSFGHVPLEVV